MQFDDLSHRVIGCAIEVHRALGLGYLSQRLSSVLLTNLRGAISSFCCNIRSQSSTKRESSDSSFDRLVFVLFASFVVQPFPWVD